ncbi:MAG: LysR family transcriptional regulator [Lachnospiraceae bacterium]
MTNNLELYKVFYYAARTGSITGAAAELSITQPAVSQSMKQLESLLGVKLFTRTAKGIRLTHEGAALFPYVAKGYESIGQGEQKIRELLDLDLGEIRIGASDMTLKYYLLPYLEKFHEQYPKIKVTVYNSPTPETLSAMTEGKIDFGIVSSPLPGNLELTVKKVREIHDIFIAGSRFLHLKGRQLPYRILEQLPVICLEKNTSTRRYIDSFLKENNVSLSPEFELATSDMIVQFALRNLGIGCVMEDFAEEALANGSLFALTFSKEIPIRNFYVVNRKDDSLSSAAKALLALFH